MIWDKFFSYQFCNVPLTLAYCFFWDTTSCFPRVSNREKLIEHLWWELKQRMDSGWYHKTHKDHVTLSIFFRKLGGNHYHSCNSLILSIMRKFKCDIDCICYTGTLVCVVLCCHKPLRKPLKGSKHQTINYFVSYQQFFWLVSKLVCNKQQIIFSQ